jgi:hypothetical protein
MFLSKRLSIAVSSLLFCATLLIGADEATKTDSNESVGFGASEAKELTAINVKSSKNGAGEGEVLDSQKLKNSPTPTNSITDKLRQNSDIQYSQNSRSSAQGGEITPPKISIRGAQHYENNFMINGISNNNNLNPGGTTNPWSSTSFSTEAQSMFIDTSLIESVAVYTENIGAQYGSFTGGVVDAKLRDARMDGWHTMANFRYTKDSWAKYHLTEAQKNITQSTSESYQPEFTKYEYNIAADGPINDHLGLLLSYGEQHSKIPLWSSYNVYNPDNSTYKERRMQFRDTKNFLVRLNTHDFDDFEAGVTALYAPYTGTYFSSTWRDSDMELDSGGFSLAYDMKNHLKIGSLESTLSFKEDIARNDGMKEKVYQWKTVPGGYANWGTASSSPVAAEGSYESVKSDIKQFAAKSMFDFDEITTGSFEHTIKVGGEAEYAKLNYEKGKSDRFQLPELNSSAVGSKENGVIEGEQWATRKVVYLPAQAKKNYTTWALFFEDTMEHGRFTIRPGVRLSGDTLTHNKDIAPRFFISADVFDDDMVNVYGGYNRYYGTQILSYAIPGYGNVIYTRTSWDDNWTLSSTSNGSKYDLGSLKTPYSDEFNIGTTLDLRGTLFKIDYVKRDYKDQLRSRYANSTYTMTNRGESKYWGVTLGASRDYDIGNTKHVSDFSFTRSATKSPYLGFSGFSSVKNTAYSSTHVTYNGQLILDSELPASQFNSPWIATYSHLVQIGQNLRVNAILRYEKGGQGVKYLSVKGIPDPEGLPTYEYEDREYGNTFNIDLSANYDLKVKGHTFNLGVDALNLLNRKNDASYTSSASGFTEGYSMGRQLYANFKYEF